MFAALLALITCYWLLCWAKWWKNNTDHLISKNRLYMLSLSYISFRFQTFDQRKNYRIFHTFQELSLSVSELLSTFFGFLNGTFLRLTSRKIRGRFLDFQKVIEHFFGFLNKTFWRWGGSEVGFLDFQIVIDFWISYD